MRVDVTEFILWFKHPPSKDCQTHEILLKRRIPLLRPALAMVVTAGAGSSCGGSPGLYYLGYCFCHGPPPEKNLKEDSLFFLLKSGPGTGKNSSRCRNRILLLRCILYQS